MPGACGMSDLHLHAWGRDDAPPLLLLHGLTEAGTTWSDSVPVWAARWRVIAPDLRGHGQSPRFAPAQLADTWTTFLDDVVQLLRETGHGDPVTVVGHSLGGRIAAIVGRDHPVLVARLVLEDPPLTSWSAAPPTARDTNREFLAGFTNDTLQDRILEATQTTNWTVSEIDAWAHCKPQVDPALIDHLDLGEMQATATLNNLRVPTLLLTPGNNPHVPTPAEITNPLITYALVPEAGHCIRRDSPAHYHRLVDAFLEESRDNPD